MRFVLQMAWRDSKASRRRLALFSLCVVCGIAALVALDSFAASLQRAVAEESRSLLGADLVVGSRAALPPPVEREAKAAALETATQVSFSSMMVFGPPDSPAAPTRLVQVRAWTGGFPFYGQVVTEPAAAVATLRAAERSGERVAVVEQTLLAQFQVKVGETVRLGRADFRVVGALEKISGDSLVVTQLAPRVLVPQAALAGAGLDTRGPLVRWQTALRLPPGADAEAIARRWRERFAAERLSIETVAGRRRELGRALTNVDSFLSLVGFVALLLGAVGVASAMHAYTRRKIPIVATLRCLGASARQATAVYLVQAAAVGALGSALGGALGLVVQALIPRVASGLLPFAIPFTFSAAGLSRGVATGFVLSILFTLLPLLGLRSVPPLAALRGTDAGDGAPAAGWLARLVQLAIAAAVAGFAIWQTRSVRIGTGFALAVGAGFAVFYGSAWLVAALARRFPLRRAPYPVRQGVSNLHRPQNRTALLLVALGLATFLSFSLFLTRTAFLRELDAAGSGDRPNLMFFDVQEDQAQPLDALLAARHVPRQEAAVIAMKIAALNGRPVDDLLREGRDPPAGREAGKGSGRSGWRLPPWTLRREYRSTVRDHLSETEHVVSGTFTGRFDPGPDPDQAIAPISVDQGLAEDMRLRLGDTIDWDVQGLIVHTRVGSIRAVEWRRLAPNFFVVFPRGPLDAAPKFHVFAVRTVSPADSAALQSEVVRRFPNVSSIDLASLLQTLDAVFSKVAFVVQFMALFTAGTAVLVLGSVVVAGRQQRRRETLLLRTLGASARQLRQIAAVEYAVLGALAAVLGCLLGWAGSGALDRWVFSLPASAPPLAFAAAIGAVTTVTLLAGWLSDRGLPLLPPLEALRAED